MSLLIIMHAIGASLALTLGAVNLIRRPRGDRVHRGLGKIWVVAMYWTVISSFFIREINPGHFSWIHGLSVFTFFTLTIGLWAAVTHRVSVHAGYMRGTYLGTVGAFVGAVAVPQRAIPQVAVHHPLVLSAVAFAVLMVTTAIVAAMKALTRPTVDVRRPSRL